MEIDRIQRKSHLRLPWANNACWSCPPTDSDSGMCLQHKGLKDLYQFQLHQVLFLIWEIAPRLTKALSIINSQPKSTHSYVMSLDLMEISDSKITQFLLCFTKLKTEATGRDWNLPLTTHFLPQPGIKVHLCLLTHPRQVWPLFLFFYTHLYSQAIVMPTHNIVFYLIYSYHANMCCSGCINSSAYSHNPPLLISKYISHHLNRSYYSCTTWWSYLLGFLCIVSPAIASVIVIWNVDDICMLV